MWWFSYHPATLKRNFVPHPLPVWVGQVHESIAFENRCFMPHFGSSLFSIGGLPQLRTLDLWSRRSLNCVQTKCEAWGSYGLGMVTTWKTAKNCVFRDMVSFLISYHIYCRPSTTRGQCYIVHYQYRPTTHALVWSQCRSAVTSTVCVEDSVLHTLNNMN